MKKKNLILTEHLMIGKDMKFKSPNLNVNIVWVREEDRNKNLSLKRTRFYQFWSTKRTRFPWKSSKKSRQLDY